MFRRFRNDNASSVDGLIDVVLEKMHDKGVFSDEYPDLLAYLERLNEVKAKERQDAVSRDTIAIVAGNLLGILLIVAYEQKHVMTSKGLAQLIRAKTKQTD